VWIEQEMVEIPPTSSSSVKRGALGQITGGILLIALLAMGAFWIVGSNDWQPTPREYRWYWWGSLMALLALAGFTLEYGFWRVAAWVIGAPLGLVALWLLLIFSPQIWSNLQDTFSAPLTFGGAFVLMLIFSSLFAGGRS
jgi:hypothetical protein